jgi:hypothetical protein
MGGSDVHDMSYYAKCMMGGILSCGLTHMVVCPLDIVKCRKQVCALQITKVPFNKLQETILFSDEEFEADVIFY